MSNAAVVHGATSLVLGSLATFAPPAFTAVWRYTIGLCAPSPTFSARPELAVAAAFMIAYGEWNRLSTSYC